MIMNGSAEIKSRQKQYLEELFKLLRQKSISAANIGMEECANLLKEMMESYGISSRLIETKGYPVVYGEILSPNNKFTLLIYGHYDVQSPDPLEEWNTPPFEPTIKGNKIYCRGVGDNKGQLMAQLLAVKTYKELYGELPINIKFVFEGEEEQGSVNLESFVSANKDLLKADLVYASDGSSHQSDSPFVLLGVRGMLYLELHAKGADFDNHSGNKGNIVPNPVWKLINLLSTMRDREGNVLIKGFYDNIRKPTDYENQLLETIPFDAEEVGRLIGYSDLEMDGWTYHHKLTMEPTFNICGIKSGYTEKGAKTVIPSKAEVKIDIRLVVDQDPDDIFNKVCEHVQQYAPDIEVKHLFSVKPSRTSVELEVVQEVITAIRESFQTEPIIQPSLGGSIPNYVWTDILKVPALLVPYANFDQGNHAPNENMDIDYFLRAIKCTFDIIHRLGSYQPSITPA